MYILILHRAKKKCKQLISTMKGMKTEIGRYDRVMGNYYIYIINAIPV